MNCITGKRGLCSGFPDLIHHYQVFSKGSNEVYQFYASLELSGSFMTLLQKKYPENPVIKKANLPYEIRNSLECLIRMREVNEIVGQAYLQIMLYQCSKLFQFIEKDNMGSHDLIYTVMMYLLSHFQEELTLRSVAEALGINKFALAKVFSGVFHTNFNQYLNEIRLNYASSLLENTDKRITDIYLEAGFESQRTFNRAFQQKYGRTPSEYRRTCLEKWNMENQEEPKEL